MIKSTSRWGGLASAITEAISALGPMTGADLCEHLGNPINSVSTALSRMIKTTPKHPQRLHISGWVWDHEGQRAYPRAQYSLGPGKNRECEPPITTKARHAQRQADKLRLLKTSSVFNLGVTREQFTQRRKQARQSSSKIAPLPNESSP